MQRRGLVFVLDGGHKLSKFAKYIPFAGRFFVDIEFLSQLRPYYSSLPPKPMLFRLLTFLENTLLYVLVGTIIGSFNLSLLPFIPIFVVTGLIEWSLIRRHGHGIKLFNWGTISKMPSSLAAKLLAIIMYQAFLFMLLGTGFSCSSSKNCPLTHDIRINSLWIWSYTLLIDINSRYTYYEKSNTEIRP